MPLYPLGISRRREIQRVPKQAAGAVDMCWSLAGELACAYIDAPHQAVPPMLHATVLDAIHRRICIVPLRFGTALNDEDELRVLLQSQEKELSKRLDRLDSTCEMALRIALSCPSQTPAAVATSAASPLAYLSQRRSHYQAADEIVERDRLIVEQVVERLQGCYREWRKLQASVAYGIRLAFLVERKGVAAFQSRLEGIGGADRQWRCVLLGPWPPYSFV
jgi:hypothetical protein